MKHIQKVTSKIYINCIYGKYIYILLNTIVYVIICIIHEVFKYYNIKHSVLYIGYKTLHIKEIPNIDFIYIW